MGHSTELDPYCDDCSHCHDAGKTPCIKYISFTGIIDCHPDPLLIPAPFNKSVRVDQLEGHPCKWYRLFDDDQEFLYDSALLDGSEIQYFWIDNWFFSGWQPDNCQVHFSNTRTCAGGHFGENGKAVVMWNTDESDHSIGSLMHAINMEPEAETKFELWPAADGKTMVRFARKKDATNILILVEPTEL